MSGARNRSALFRRTRLGKEGASGRDAAGAFEDGVGHALPSGGVRGGVRGTHIRSRGGVQGGVQDTHLRSGHPSNPATRDGQQNTRLPENILRTNVLRTHARGRNLRSTAANDSSQRLLAVRMRNSQRHGRDIPSSPLRVKAAPQRGPPLGGDPRRSNARLPRG